MNKIKNTSNSTTGLKTGFSKLDEITGNFQYGDLIILASRPGIGKTSFALNILSNIAASGYKTMMFSFDLNSVELLNKLHTIELFVDTNILIDDKTSLTISKIENKIRTVKEEKGLQLVAIDYLQLINGDNKKSRDEEIEYIIKKLKNLAKELKIVILLLSQLSRKVDNRPNKKPQIQDLRERIEDYANKIIFIYRDSVYNNKEIKEDITKIIVAKNQNGATQSFLYEFEKN